MDGALSVGIRCPSSSLAFFRSPIHRFNLLKIRSACYSARILSLHLGQFSLRSAYSTGRIVVEADAGNYGGWDDLGPSNSNSTSWNSIWDLLESSKRGKSLLVLGFGLLLGWSVARARTTWWLYFPLCGVVSFVILQVGLHEAMQEVICHRKSKIQRRNGKIPTDSSSSGKRIISDQIAVLSDELARLVVKFSSLDKSAQAILLHNDINLDELKHSLDSLKTLEATILKLDENSHLASSTKKVNLDQQMHASLSGEERFYEKIHFLTEESQQNHRGYLDGQFRNMQSYLDWNGFDIVQFCKRIFEDSLVREEDEPKASQIKTGTPYSKLGKLQTERDSQFKHVVSKPPIVMTKPAGINGELTKSFELGNKSLITNGVATIPETTGSSNQPPEDIRGVNSVKRGRSQISTESPDRSSSEEYCTSTEAADDYGHEGQQVPNKDGSISEQFGGSEQLGIKDKGSSLDNGEMINKSSAEKLDEGYTVKRSDKLYGFHMNTRRKSQGFRNQVDITGQSTIEDQKDNKPLTSFAIKNEDMVKEQDLLETNKSCLISSDQSRLPENSSYLSKLSEPDDWQPRTQGGKHGSRGNNSDGYREEDKVLDKVSPGNITGSNYDCEARVNRRTVAASSSYVENPDISNAENLSSISKGSEDEKYQRYLDKGEALLKEAQNGLKGKIEVSAAECLLYEAADLFSTAAAINPSSLVAVGQWGNALLVHGELKLKLSQQLRSLLLARDDSFGDKGQKWQFDELRLAMTERETIAETLQEVCEECDQLLVEAGRKYRTALSLDKHDVRSLYNWGLALCFRARLTEEGGEEAVKDADKIYLAAIDKFEAMMGISQVYAPHALLNWGLALRNRSHMRPMGSKERSKLLQQARQLFQDALSFNPQHAQAKTAIISCVAELKELEEYRVSPSWRQEQKRSKISWNME